MKPHRVYLEAVDAVLSKWAEQYAPESSAEPIDKIEADRVVVEVADKATGRVFRRNLPVHYMETGNGIILGGETAEGKPVQLAFFSGDALARMSGILGKGPDSHRCQEK